MTDTSTKNSRDLFSESGWFNEKTPRAIRPHRPNPIRALVTVSIIMLLASILGISSAYMVIEREQPLGAITIGPWQAYPNAGTVEADPYSVAIYTRGAVIPLASGEGLALVARKDSAGNLLDPTCEYRIIGQTPTARLWTLTAVNGRGNLLETRPGRTHITSQNILRNQTGSFEITAADHARSGNWLPLSSVALPSDGLRFILRLYDAPVTTGSALGGVNMPVIEMLNCS